MLTVLGVRISVNSTGFDPVEGGSTPPLPAINLLTGINQFNWLMSLVYGEKRKQLLIERHLEPARFSRELGGGGPLPHPPHPLKRRR